MLRLPRLALSVGAVLLAFLSTGCLSEGRLVSDVREAREARYQGWVDRTTSAEQPAPLTGELSLNDSILVALGNSRQVQIALLQKERAAARVVEARAAALPTISGSATYTRLDEVATVSGVDGTTIGELDNYSLSGTVTQPLFKGGAVSAGIRAARIYSVLTDEQLRGTYQTVIYDVRKAYYDALLAAELVKADTEAVRVAAVHLDDAQKNFEAGTVAAFDVLRAKVEISNLTAQQVQDQNRYHLAITTLYNLLGVSQDSAATLSTPLTYEPFSPEMNQAVQKAFLLQTDLLQGELNVRLYREALANARAPYWPEVNAFFNGVYARPDPHDALHHDWNQLWSAGVEATYIIFQGFKTMAQVRQAEIDLRQNRITLFDTEQRVLLQVRQAILSIEDAARFVRSQEANVEQAQEALRLATLGFNHGSRKQVEVDDARRALTTALANLAQAKYNHQVAKLDFERATGTISPPSTGSEAALPGPASGE